MDSGRKTFKQRWEKLKKPFRLVFINPETFQEFYASEITRLGIILGILGSILLAVLITVAAIFFTPLRTFVPGYADVEQHPELMRLNESFRQMEEELEAQRNYTENFKRILVGEILDEQQTEMPNEEFPDSLLNVERIAEDELLRAEIKLGQQIQEREILSSSGMGREYEVPLDQAYLIPPVTGMISAKFDPAINHFGADITAPKNTPVKSIMEGFVFISDWTLETGQTIGIQHRNDLISFYKHNSALLKKTGDLVKSGEAIAIIGNTGTLSSGPHLHFELWYKGVPVDPEEYINFN